MNEPVQAVNGALRLRSELFARQVEKDGRPIAVFRGIEGEDCCTVEFEVHSADGESVRPGRFRFDTRVEASRFVDEATLALQYLGCSIS
jgi:hypothetical protein